MDLVGRLLKLNPIDRLGSGKLDSENDMLMLLRHPFFADMN